MSDFDPDYDPNTDDTDNDDEGKKVLIDRSHIRALEKKAAKADDAQRLVRENALLKLGVDTESHGGKLLLNDASLPWDKPEEISEIAKGINAMRAPATETTSETETEGENQDPDAAQNAAVADQVNTRTGLANGAAHDTDSNQADPRKEAATEAKEAMRRGARESEAVGHYFNQIAKAANSGDKRVVAER